MKPREKRIPVQVPARLRHQSGWSDAIVLNMSSKGLMFSSSVPIQRGEYVELRRGPYVIVARVAWASGTSCGAQSQDRLPIEEIVQLRSPARRASPTAERRRAPRPTSEKHAESRWAGQLIERSALGMVAVIVAVLISNSIYALLSEPLESVIASLAVN